MEHPYRPLCAPSRTREQVYREMCQMLACDVRRWPIEQRDKFVRRIDELRRELNSIPR